jgi:hypothetical protein
MKKMGWWRGEKEDEKKRKERKKSLEGGRADGGVEPAMIFGWVGASWRNGFGAVPPVLSELH